MDQKVPMTPRGFELLKNELNKLKTVERPANIRDIELALEEKQAALSVLAQTFEAASAGLQKHGKDRFDTEWQ